MNSRPPPVGYGFHPTDEELVTYYLRFKMHGGYEQEVSIIAEANVCDYEPWVLPELSAIKEPNDPECYFFCPRSYKYANSDRANRTTQAGYWKVTGKDRIVKTKTTKEHIATKKTLVFYEGRVPNGIKTNWIMHEYHPNFSFPNQREFVLCKLKKDPDAIMPTYEEGEASFNVTSDHFENQNPTEYNHPQTFEEGEASFNVTSDHFENQNPTEYNHPQTFEEGEYGAWTASNFTNDEPEDDTYQFQAQLDSLRGYDEGCYSLDSALKFPYGDIY
ncbi:hypothetical protein POPTR_014G107700v4 [Populus trichocarpa]|uniref:NAC domain-containing protein n=1 Tax=Populus trichocarpa TaxID=3694 RepID=A0A3N7G157_POPTR|nr:hypothetical protein BDE02_14G089300 [Populus trichocarpa]KAI5564918.1 hypothetical protein BDE02_14G089300 [Populus trichocarpa]RQP00025.1 hypothetical protein POPTR_014G107700v4 [Populus trichocarpa]RQP00026.1 hypothetical protein POPTR_014G107700v4 [Populus trichocarpa]|eukprot:XP_024440064.1 protein NTM1-like 9 isoform X5 [Populus trichocarpa]